MTKIWCFPHKFTTRQTKQLRLLRLTVVSGDNHAQNEPNLAKKLHPNVLLSNISGSTYGWNQRRSIQACPLVGAVELWAGVFLPCWGPRRGGSVLTEALLAIAWSSRCVCARIPLISAPLCLSPVISSFKDQYVTPPSSPPLPPPSAIRSGICSSLLAFIPTSFGFLKKMSV